MKIKEKFLYAEIVLTTRFLKKLLRIMEKWENVHFVTKE